MSERDSNALTVDPGRFTGEGSDLSLLAWLRGADQALDTLPTEAIAPAVEGVHKLVLRLLVPASVSPATALPKPGRPIRHLVARVVVKLHKRIENRQLFDLIQALLKGVDGGNKSMSQLENVQRVASWYTIGEVIKEHGANMMSVMAEITTLSVKTLRNSNFSVLLRTQAVYAFAKSLISAGRALPDALVKDLLKNLRSGLQDKALPVQRASAEAFINLHQYSPVLPLQATLDSVFPLVLKSLETADYLTRRSLSQLLAHFLAATQVSGSGYVAPDPRKAPAKKDKDKEREEEDGAPQVVTSAPEDKVKALFTPEQMLKHLSVPYNRHNAPRKLRNAIMDVYATLLTRLGAEYVEAHYTEIVDHIIEEIVLQQRPQTNRFEMLQTREAVGIIIRDLIGVSMLTEAGQVMAIREWTNNYLRKWNQTPLAGQKNPNKNALIIALQEVAGLLGQLGNAPPAVLEQLAEPLVRLLSHESYSVRTAAAYTLRRFTTTNPSQLARLLGGLLADINKDLELLKSPTAPKDLPTRILGRAVATAALVSVSPSRPLYVSNDIPSKVFDLAVSLLKRAGDHDVAIATVEVQVAWYLIAALMSLGPGLVKLHLPQLLVLWRNALPKPSSKDSVVGDRGEAEWNFLLVVRESALSAIHNFLKHNAALVNIDVARRIATLLTNSLNFVNGFATAYAELLREQAANPSGVSSISQLRPSLVEREANLRRRVMQCFTDLGPSSATESMQPALLQAAVTLMADPENYSGSGAQAAIAAQAGQFANVWQSVDGYAFGITSLLAARERERGASEEDVFLNRDKIEMAIEGQLSAPIMGSVEYDYLELFSASTLANPPRPVPAQTGVIDAGILLFATLFAHQNLEGQVQSLATLSSHVRSSKLERNPGRRQAVVANTMEALRRSLEHAESAGLRARRALGSPQVSDLIKSLLQDAVLHEQPSIRGAAAQAMGHLSALAGSAYLSSQVQWLVDQVVNNRVPESRAGCAVAFGEIYGSVGGLSGGPILKTIVNILMSLATDPHPVVHYWALTALTQIVNSANLSYSQYVQTTLGMIANIYLLETHEPEGGSLGSVNLRGDLPAYQIICRLLHALIGVLGPELQEPGKVRSLVFLLVHEFREETDEGLAVEAIKCIQQFLMFAPAEVDVPKLVSSFRTYLASTRRPLKVAAITALYQIVQRDAVLMSKVGGNQLVEELFGLLDNDPTIEGVKAVITSWLLQTAAALPSGWIDLCQRIMTRTAVAAAAAKAPKASTNAPMFLDDEAQSLGGDSANQTSALNSRWRTQLFALQCLHNIVNSAADGSKPEHFDPVLARRLGVNPRHMLLSRVGDLIRMAFSASAALVEDVRLAGLQVLRDVIERFAASPDPDFEGALLLEQHQAPIAAALTPSFGSDSTPEVLASAVQVCAVFVGSGVVKEVSRMGRILKLLTSALEQCKSNDLLQLGDVTDLSSSASVMLKISILAAWAELQIASLRQSYLESVLKPYRYLLGSFWVGALRDYAQLRTDPEMGAAGGMDYSTGLGRDVLLPYYEAAVPKLLHAVAIGLASNDPFMIGAVDGATYTSSEAPSVPQGPTIRAEPSANFFILYGLAFESLTRSLGSDPAMASVVLKVMTALVHPQLSGTTVFDGAFFDEMCTLCYRIAMSEPAAVKADMVDLVAAFATSRKGMTGVDSAQIRRALAIVAFVLRGTIPAPQVATTFSPSDSAADRVAFLKTAFAAYARIVEVMDMAQRADLCAVAIHLFADLLHDETPNMDLAGQCLPSLKLILDLILGSQVPTITATSERVLHGLLGACLNNVDEMRTRVNPVASIKIKNNLLALVLILTALPLSARVSKPVVEQIASDIGRYMSTSSERPELGLTPIHCATTLLLASLRPVPGTSKPSPVLQHAAMCVLTPLIGFVADAVVSLAETSEGPTAIATLEGLREVIRGLVAWCNGLPEDVKPRGYGILVPTLCLLLDPGADSSDPSPAHQLATNTLLQLAASSPKAFKDATQAMPEGERSGLERAVREAVGARAAAKPQQQTREERKGIALKSFGA